MTLKREGREREKKRGEGSGGEDKKEHPCERKHQRVASHRCPDWESSPQPIDAWDNTLMNLATQSGLYICL